MSVPTASPVNQWQSCHWSRRQSTRTSGVLVLFTSLPQSVVFPQSCSCSFLLLLPALLGTSPWCHDWRKLFHCVIPDNSCNHSLSEQHSIHLSTLPLVETEVCCLRNFKDSSKRRILILLFCSTAIVLVMTSLSMHSADSCQPRITQYYCPPCHSLTFQRLSLCAGVFYYVFRRLHFLF